LIFKEIRKNYDSDYSKNERINEWNIIEIIKNCKGIGDGKVENLNEWRISLKIEKKWIIEENQEKLIN
jgi:hypothetical protein